jgi:glycosyltransferase involved in cell wall biosynthesis
MKKLAILIPVFNDQSGLDLALDSIVLPEDMGATVIVVDDGSEKIIEIDASKYNFDFEIITLEENQGIVVALNKGLSFILENGYDYIARLDSGDAMLAKRLRLQMDKLDERPELMLVGGAVKFVNSDGTGFEVQKPINKIDIMKRFWSNSPFCHTAVMFKACVIKEVGFYNENYPAAEDYDFFWRISNRFEVMNIGDVVVNVDNNPLGISISRRKTQLKSRLKIQLENFEKLEFRSYLGIMKTLILFIAPVKLLGIIKRKLGVVS